MQAYIDKGGSYSKKSFPSTSFLPLIAVGYSDTNSASFEMWPWINFRKRLTTERPNINNDNYRLLHIAQNLWLPGSLSERQKPDKHK